MTSVCATDWNCYCISDHAAVRAQQRGVRKEVIGFILEHADKVLHAGEGCLSLLISRTKHQQLRRNGYPASIIERASEVVIILNPRMNRVVTVMHMHSRKERRFLKQQQTHSTKHKRHAYWVSKTIH